MVSVSGIEVKFGRIFFFVVLVVGLIVVYNRYGSGHGKIAAKEEKDAAGGGEVARQNSAALASEGASSTDFKLQPNGKVELTTGSGKCALTYISVEPASPKNNKFLLLHGAAYTAETWNETGTMAKLKEWGYTAVAIDLKPEDELEKCAASNETRAELIHKMVEKLGLAKVVVVSPSKSGELSIPYIMKPEYHSEIAGFVPVAPVIDSSYKAADFEKLKNLKVLIVQGEIDISGLDKSSFKLLSNVPNNKVAKIKDAGHACYKDKPDEWHNKLKDFLDEIKI